MEPTDLTIEILKGIREEAQKTNERLDRTNDRLDGLRTEVRSGFSELRGELEDVRGVIGELRDRQTASEVHVATELVGVAGAVREVRDLLREDRALRVRVEDHERRISEMERRTG
ncbi:MAG TPA: hypothetical protein VIF09_07655 [Polyangiaceae bacterium]|jgi:chromosome segregation ATPase